MSIYSEGDRLCYFQHGEMPSHLYATLVFECDDGEECLMKIISVMRLIVEQDREHWQDDSYWREKLPKWLTKTFRTYSPQELSDIRSDRSKWTNLAWTFGSWIDRMRDRDWEWWSSILEENKVKIHLVIEGYPFTAKALEHLISAAGGRFLHREETGQSDADVYRLA